MVDCDSKDAGWDAERSVKASEPKFSREIVGFRNKSAKAVANKASEEEMMADRSATGG